MEQQIPGLILPPSSNSHSGTREFIRLTEIINNPRDQKKRKRNLVPWRLAEGSLCIAGSLRGWILVLNCDLKMVLLDPLTGSEVALPEDPDAGSKIRPSEFASWGFWHTSTWATIWAPLDHSVPVSDWFVIVLMPAAARRKTYIKYCRVGDGAGWGVMEFPACRLGPGFIVDALCNSVEAGYLYVLMTTRELFRCSFSKKMKTTVVEMTSKSPDQVGAFKPEQEFNYLVEVEGEILVLHRNTETQGHFPQKVYCRTRGFDVYRFDRERKQWVLIKEFGAGGDFAVFLGLRQPLSIGGDSALGIKGNCICFLELGSEKRYISVFDMKTSAISFLPVSSAFERPCAAMPVQVPIPMAPLP